MSSPRQSIISDEEVRKLVDDMLAMPERVRAAQDLIEDAQFELATFSDGIEAHNKLDEIKAETYFEVRATKDESTGKPAFSNEETRQAQVMIRCTKDAAYIAALNDVAQAARHKAELQMHIGKLINQAKWATNLMYSYKSAAEIVAGLAVEDVDAAAFRRLASIRSELTNIITKYGGTNGNG